MTSQGRGGSEQQLCIIYAVCHVMGMLSACANPIIYGFLNENFHREFTELYQSFKSTCCCCFLRRSPSASSTSTLRNNNDLEVQQTVRNPAQPQIEMAPLMNENGGESGKIIMANGKSGKPHPL